MMVKIVRVLTVALVSFIRCRWRYRWDIGLVPKILFQFFHLPDTRERFKRVEMCARLYLIILAKRGLDEVAIWLNGVKVWQNRVARWLTIYPLTWSVWVSNDRVTWVSLYSQQNSQSEIREYELNWFGLIVGVNCWVGLDGGIVSGLRVLWLCFGDCVFCGFCGSFHDLVRDLGLKLHSP